MSDAQDDLQSREARIVRSSRASLARTGLVLLVMHLLTGIARAEANAFVEAPSPWSLIVMQAATVVWVFAIGASIGSFLNVVVYRLPLGLSLSSPPSRCPACGLWIERRDNVPVFGWLLLRGRCRACGVAISPRYPIVEATVGLLFVALLFVELASGGANLPVRQPDAWRGLVATLWSLRWELIGLTLYHLFLLTSLLGAALMAHDRASTRRLWPTVLLVGLVAPLAWPWLRPVPAVLPRSEELSATWLLPGLLDGAAGMVVGFLVGGLLALGLPSSAPARRTNVVAMFLAVGAFLGWQAAVSVGLLVLASWLLVAIVGRMAKVGACPEALVAVASVGQVVAWRALSSLEWWPGPGQPLAALGGLVLVCLAAVPLRALATSRTAMTSNPPEDAPCEASTAGDRD